MKDTAMFGVVLLLVLLFGVLGIAQVSSSASASASSDGPMEVAIGTFSFASGDSLALEIVRDEPCACMCDPISVIGFHLQNTDGAVPVKLLNDPVLPLPIKKWVGMLSLVSPDGSPLSPGQYTAVVETSAGTFKSRITVAEPSMSASSWGRVSSSASICGVEIRLYRLLPKDTAASINLRVGDRLMVALAENSTTGYEWQQVASEEEAILSPLPGLDYLPDAALAGTVGSGGTFLSRFSTDRAGTMNLTFTYHQPWEEGPGAETVTFHVAVN